MKILFNILIVFCAISICDFSYSQDDRIFYKELMSAPMTKIIIQSSINKDYPDYDKLIDNIVLNHMDMANTEAFHKVLRSLNKGALEGIKYIRLNPGDKNLIMSILKTSLNNARKYNLNTSIIEEAIIHYNSQ